MLPLPYVAAGALAVGLLTGWTTNGWRLNAKIDGMVAEHSLAVKAATEKAMAETARMQKEKDDAIAKAQEQARANAAAADVARTQRDGLRDELAASRTAYADSTHASLTAHAQTLSVVFEQCVREYSELAAKADAHALDTQILFDAWKGITK
jgi:hypothetical protein